LRSSHNLNNYYTGALQSYFSRPGR